MPDRSAPTLTPDPRRERAAFVAWLLVRVEALVVLGLAVLFVVEVALGRGGAAAPALISAALMVVVAAGLWVVATGLRARRRWARAPSLTWQILCLPVAVSLVQSGRWELGLPLAALALSAAVTSVASPVDDD